MTNPMRLAAFTLIVVAIIPGLAVANTVQEFIKQGDELFAQRADFGKAKAAVDAYRQAAQANPVHKGAALKLAKALYWYGINLPKGKDLSVYKEAMETAKTAVKLAPDSAEAHYYYGATLGLYGQAKGVMSSLSLVDSVKKEMQTVIKIEPCFQSGAAYRALGRVFFKLPAAFGGSNKKAGEYYEKALKCGPDSLLTHLWMADLYRDEGDHEKAEELFTKALHEPCAKADWPECHVLWKPDARKMMKQFAKKK